MTTRPTGRLDRTDGKRDLILTRTYRAPIEDVWASVTESDRTARWFGPWKGEAGPGRKIQVQMALEEGQPWCDATIEVCEPPRRLGIITKDDYGTWHLEAELTETDGVTELVFTHHLDPEAKISEVGPGWEYYLDALGAARTDADRPDFEDYYPSMKQYYEALED
ncbi:SRPBCC family protein [Nocardia sp. CS682]|uniref:SRPBCC family protein n=1 Tax=Nocardia sp. CS682 TaxID=1047172 RepID=UPI001074BB90|nr:SRPBCC family protein [Nocardia sp. CS682]QBS40060.1 ATPase [Nocardia sp. CS682]